MMKYLAERSQRGAVCSGPSVADALVMSTPLLETFGNGKTLRNNNSSRFGKFTQILFDGPNIIGSRVEVYLLEKSRIVQQHEGALTMRVIHRSIICHCVLFCVLPLIHPHIVIGHHTGERAYHIFYQLMCADEVNWSLQLLFRATFSF